LGGSLLYAVKIDPALVEVNAIMDEIRSLNLINSLYLSPEQKDQLLCLAEKARAKRLETQKIMLAEKNKLEDLLQNMKQELKNEPSLSPRLTRQYQDIMNKIEKSELEQINNLKSLTREVKSLLSTNQKEVVEQYQPCVVPVKSISNPERVGQADGGNHFTKLLEKVREVPEKKYPEVKQKILDKIKEKLLLRKMPEDKINLELEQAGRIMDKARRLSEEDFALQKEKLGEKLAPGKPAAAGNNLDLKIERLLLSDGALKALQESR